MTDRNIETGVRNLDALLGGGLPGGSITVIGGPPGGGKTILAQQICFHNATVAQPALYFSTLSEPTAKILRYLSHFSFGDLGKIDEGVVRFIDLGVIVRSVGLERASTLIMEHVKAARPSIVVVDSFKVFEDLARTREELRKFSYQLVVNLMAWDVTALLLGEYGRDDFELNTLFSVVDGMLWLTQRELSGEQQRFIRVLKLRGMDHNRDDHPFQITSAGIEVFAPRVTLERRPSAEDATVERLRTGLPKLDELLGEGIPRGSTLLVSGVAGTGKTALSLEFIYRGALMGEKGIVFSFEETSERLRASARGLGWDLDREIERGMVELVFIPQPSIWVERHLLMMHERVKDMQARRVALDSLSVFLHKVKDPQICREKTFQLATIIQNARAVGFFATDVPYGSSQISRFGVEETVVDGVILLSSTEEGFERQRYLEVYKLRNTAHAKGRHNMVIGPGGVAIFPRYDEVIEEPRLGPVKAGRRLTSGVSGLDPLVGGGLMERSVTLVTGSAGIGKTTLALQFVLAGAASDERGIFVALEEDAEQLSMSAESLGMPLADAVARQLVEIVHLGGRRVRANQLLAILTDRIVALRATRLVLDGASHLVESSPPGELRNVLYRLIARFKSLGVTSLITQEANAMSPADAAAGGHFSPLADNLIALRYHDHAGELRPTLCVLKTRGSPHDFRRYGFTVGPGGVKLGDPAGDAPKAVTR